MVLPFQLTREERKECIDTLEDICKKLPLSKKSLGILFRSFHVGTPPMMFIILLIADQWVASMSAFGLLLVALSFYHFNGCFLSMLENRLCHDDFTIADPFLEVMHLDATNENRLVGTYSVAITFIITFLIVYYIRFW